MKFPGSEKNHFNENDKPEKIEYAGNEHFRVYFVHTPKKKKTWCTLQSFIWIIKSGKNKLINSEMEFLSIKSIHIHQAPPILQT